jgi:hypothetical protein
MDKCLMLLLSIEVLTGLKPTAYYCVVLMLYRNFLNQIPGQKNRGQLMEDTLPAGI